MQIKPKSRKPYKEHMVDNDIIFPTFFLMDEDGSKIGVVKKNQAIEMAKAKKMNVVIISGKAQSPVAKIMDYGRFRYDRKKKQKEIKSKQVLIKNREVRLTPFIGTHDLQTKAKKVREFLLDGDRVKVSLKFRGRELSRTEIGYTKLNEFFKFIEDIGEIQKGPILNNRFLDMYLFKKTIKKPKEANDAKKEIQKIIN